MADDLINFLRTRLNKDEAVAQAATGGPWSVDDPSHTETIYSLDRTAVVGGGRWGGEASVFETTEDALHIARHDPARVLREVDSKRQLIARGGPFCTSNCDEPGNEPMDPGTNWTTPLEHHLDCAAYEAAKLMALPYADHPEYDEAWRP